MSLHDAEYSKLMRVNFLIKNLSSASTAYHATSNIMSQHYNLFIMKNSLHIISFTLSQTATAKLLSTFKLSNSFRIIFQKIRSDYIVIYIFFPKFLFEIFNICTEHRWIFLNTVNGKLQFI